jgi:dienelactone hydrolase
VSRFRTSAVSLLLLTFLPACSPTLDGVRPTLMAADAGTIAFASAGTLNRTPTRLIPGDPVALSGNLRFPAGPGPFRAVVLAHGCGGVGNAERGWVGPLNDAGYATFVIDSFTSRGFTEVCTQGRVLVPVQRIPDAYGALRILSTHPRIDAGRIALMGFSHGGSLTLGAATRWARQTYAGEGAPAFRLFLPFYPGCTARYPELLALSAPVRIHSGELDDWTPMIACRELVAEQRAAGQDAEITTYPGAHHSFDNVGRVVAWLSQVDNGSACRPSSASILEPLLNGGELTSCARKGATVGGNPAATEQARRNVLGQLASLLR